MSSAARDPSSALPDYDLTAWYLNGRRVMELIGADAASTHLARLQAFGGDDHLKDIATSVAMKEAISS